MNKEKLPLKQVKQISPHLLLRIINKAKKSIKQDDVWKKICEKYEQKPEILDYIPIMFGDLDVSAKTNHGIVILNYRLLCDGDFYKDYSYIIHECEHVLQQTCGDEPTQSSDDGDYLANPFEQEAFKDQIDYISDHHGENEAEKYVDNLLEHHDVKNKKEYEDKKETLMSEV